MEPTDKPISHSMQFSSNNYANDLPQKTHCNGVDSECETIYYGVHIPSDIQVQDADGYSNVYQDKLEALKLVKKYKKARFKAFHFYHEAVEFAVHGSEFPNNNTTISKSATLCGGPGADSATKENAQPTVGEKPPPFRGPKSQDLVKLRKGIEAGNLEVVQTTIWDNPRYLISSGDTPSILQEGSRYNALHVAAKAKNREMCELILNTVSNTSFIKLLYGDDNNQDSNERAKILLDLYLNTPDKGLNETPLHFAVKFGAVEVVELLVSFPQCDKSLKNKYGKSASMIICDRCESSAAIKNKIAMLLEETFYVPVLRSEHNCTPPVIGEPFAPTSPPNFNTNILSPRLEIHAYAGPMSKEGAVKFRRVWKTPPRSLRLGLSSSSHALRKNSVDTAAALKFKDLEKGFERLGRSLAAEFDVGWKEYWSFLGAFVDLSSFEGLRLLEIFLADRFSSEYSCSSSPKYTSSSESSELISNSPKSRPKDDQESMLSPMSDLCKNLEACTLSDGDVKKYNNHVKPSLNTGSPATENAQNVMPEVQLFKPELNPFLCVEKSCQVFAHRISNDILQLLESEYSNTTVLLEMQVKQLELLMASFMDDSRFITVDFHLVHYRLGSLISSKLKDVLIQEDEYNFMRKSLEHWLASCSKQFDYFSSDDESGNYRQAAHVLKKSTSKNKQVVCLLECILVTLTVDMRGANISSIKDEGECMRIWGEAKPCACVWQTHTMRKSSFVKKANSFKYTSRGLATAFRNELENVSRQLSFEDNEQVPNNLEDHNDAINGKSAGDTNQRIESNELDLLDERYYTPPNSPSLVEDSSDDDSSDDDTFEDSFLPENDVFIEGNIPTKTDYAVYNAVKCAGRRLNPDDYPNIYRWCHAVGLYPESERISWTSPSIGRYTIGSPSVTSTPTRLGSSLSRLNAPPSQCTPPSSWFRITGANSPRDSLKCHARASLSFNL